MFIFSKGGFHFVHSFVHPLIECTSNFDFTSFKINQTREYYMYVKHIIYHATIDMLNSRAYSIEYWY